MHATLSSCRHFLLRTASLSLLATALLVGCTTPKMAETPQPLSQQQQQQQKVEFPADKMWYFLDGRPVGKQEALGSGGRSVYLFKGEDRTSNTADEAALRRDFGRKLDDGIVLVVTAGAENDPTLREFINKYSIKLPRESNVPVAESNRLREYYRKLADGQGLSDDEIAGRIIMIDWVESTPQQLRALPAGQVSTLSVSDTALSEAKYGERGKKGLITVGTKNRAK